MNHHCCYRCGWIPIEGMSEYLEIHGKEARCIVCKYSLFNQTDPYVHKPYFPSQGKDLEDLKAYAFIYGMIYAMTFSIIKVVVTMQNNFDGSVYEVGPFYTRQLK